MLSIFAYIIFSSHLIRGYHMCSRFCSLLLDSLSIPLCFSSEKHSEAAATEPLPGMEDRDTTSSRHVSIAWWGQRNKPNKPSPCHFSATESQISESRLLYGVLNKCLLIFLFLLFLIIFLIYQQGQWVNTPMQVNIRESKKTSWHSKESYKNTMLTITFHKFKLIQAWFVVKGT